jgi:hypothetical protein
MSIFLITWVPEFQKAHRIINNKVQINTEFFKKIWAEFWLEKKPNT